MDGKQEFIDVVNYINTNKIVVPKDIILHIQELTKKWNAKNKTLDDYFKMKENHTYITGFILYDSKDQKLKELWDKYIEVAMNFRLIGKN